MALTILTAANEPYWRALWQFLRSAERMAIARVAKVVVFDLGLEAATRQRLQRRFGWAVFRAFDFAAYPPHVALHTRSYAFKPMVIAQAAADYGGQLLWLDSANLFKTPDLSVLREALTRDGTYVLKGASALRLRCNVFTLDALDVPEEDRNRPERVATIIGLDTAHPGAAALIGEWKAHALVSERIAPRTKSHNPEQALLSILLFRYQREGRIGLGEEEIDISSPHPLRWMSTRNKVPVWVPVWADSLPRLYYFFYKMGDQAWLRFQQRRQLGHKAQATVGKGSMKRKIL